MNPPNKQWTIESLHPSQMADEDKEKLADMEGQFSKWDVDPKWANLLSQFKKDSIVSCGNCGLNETELGGGVKLKRCSRCKLIGYCSASCQREDWESKHRQTCCVPRLSGEAQVQYDAALNNLCQTFGQQLDSRKGKQPQNAPETKIMHAIQIQDATHPRSTVNPDLLRMHRLKDPTWKVICLTITVCRSYPRWVNIGLTPEVKPYTLPLAILLERRNPDAKVIWILDPTNAHFHEDPTIPWKSKIFVDVGEELMANVGYMTTCVCSSGKGQTCTCAEGWRIDFIRCKELPLHKCSYPAIVDLEYPKDAGTSLIYHFKQFLNNEGFLEGQKEAVQTYFTGDILDQTYNEVMATVGKDKKGNGAAKIPVFESAKLSSVDNCAMCGKHNAGLKAGLKRCARCKKVRYCSYDCQKWDWRRHKSSCIPAPANLGDGVGLLPPVTVGYNDGITFEYRGMEKIPKLQKRKAKN
ncbi:uncharacterized protein LOC118436905 [Folsomia candida]|uniref:Histone-lysine N-methyltransferase SMYD3 n=1 Tax=Folsomia candida TaxID=158441 RepID=A0A226DW85_FOLCA|nr:uncharacterized protein LOC118436905 [Folsomia candida]OXA48951.1 Histone-lysine N-methyltransferase SMYD3 [Folsomia candida]